tara:strand:+ start:130 stop:825 length:696 start_codon:yes stop_codon:yes gene_type:complete
MNVAIIPARGGSKRIPKKNIKDFCGNPMISYSIKVALKSKIFQRVIVSTDDNEIAKVSESFGAEVPFIRPKNISDDFATTGDVMSHATKWLKENVNHLASVCCIYATAPFIKKDDLIKAYNLFKENEWSFVFSATSFPFPIQRAIKLNEEGSIKMFQPEHFESRSQDLTESFHDAGQFYFGKPESWINRDKIFLANSSIFILPRWRVQDIDTTEDWSYAEKLFNIIDKKID